MRLISALLVLSAARTKLKVARAPRFTTLAECEKAYEELLMQPFTPLTTTTTTSQTPTASVWQFKTSTRAPTTRAKPTRKKTTTTTTTTLPPLAPRVVGEGMQHDATPAYFPPVSGTGKPDRDEGWDYVEHGDDWGEIFEACDAMSGQSPIDIVKYIDIGGQTKSVLWFDYFADKKFEGEARLFNDGHGLFFNVPSLELGFVKVGTIEYTAFEYNFHAPSEHTIDGQAYPLELQVMHKGPSGHLLAISILFKIGESNDFLAALAAGTPELPQWTNKGVNTVLDHSNRDIFNLDHALPKIKIHPGGDLTMYSYPGSLTQPPCAQGVDWWVTATPVSASDAEIGKIRDAIIGAQPTPEGNNRRQQPVGNRKVLVGHTGFGHHIQQTGHKQPASKTPQVRGYTSQDAPWKGDDAAVDA